MKVVLVFVPYSYGIKPWLLSSFGVSYRLLLNPYRFSGFTCIVLGSHVFCSFWFLILALGTGSNFFNLRIRFVDSLDGLLGMGVRYFYGTIIDILSGCLLIIFFTPFFISSLFPLLPKYLILLCKTLGVALIQAPFRLFNSFSLQCKALYASFPLIVLGGF